MRTVTLLLILSFVGYFTQADTIYVMHETDATSIATTLTGHLTAASHTVTNAGGDTLTDYSAFDQVWDLRHSTNLDNDDTNAYNNYMAQGGRLYVLGEHAAFDASRNNTVLDFLSSVGAGTISMTGNILTLHSQAVTSAGNSVTSAETITYNNVRTVSTTQGFLVSENNANEGTMIAWDFGDITGHSNNRMFASFDINMFLHNGPALTQEIAAFLSVNNNTVPEPSSLIFIATALVFFHLRKKSTYH